MKEINGTTGHAEIKLDMKMKEYFISKTKQISAILQQDVSSRNIDASININQDQIIADYIVGNIKISVEMKYNESEGKYVVTE